MISPSGRERVLAPVRPNAGIESEYRRRIDALIDEMNHSLLYWIGAAWKKNEPEIAKLARDENFGDDLNVRSDPGVSSLSSVAACPNAATIFFAEDASPARSLLDVVHRLVTHWQGRFDELAPNLARWFAISAKDRSDTALRGILKRSGLAVKFHTTRAVNDALQATIGENVGLIKSIASQHLTQIEGAVMRSVQRGADLGFLAEELEHQYGVTKRRAALIARDQNAKATAVVARVRQQELGITEAVWMHSAGGREPRPTHVRAGREHQRFEVNKGWYDPREKRYIWPGELINCRCVSRPVLPAAR